MSVWTGAKLHAKGVLPLMKDEPDKRSLLLISFLERHFTTSNLLKINDGT
jgi:hypothetical protein